MTRFSMLDLAPIAPGQSTSEALQAIVSTAQAAETHGYHRVWYAEHHNMKTIASSATSVLIAHVAAHTTSIRLGAGGVMLPNHSPLTIAEQFGTLSELHPSRIDLGLGRAPGGDLNTLRALRRSPHDADTFPQDVQELQGYLTGNTRIPGVHAIPGSGTNVPLYILGSSLFGAKLAAALGLPYAFASHFAPNALHDALAAYRNDYQPSPDHPEPYAIAAMNVIAADSTAQAQTLHQEVLRQRLKFMMIKPEIAATITDEQLDEILASAQGAQVKNMLKFTAVGTDQETAQWAHEFAAGTGADELIVTHAAGSLEDRLNSIQLFGTAMRG